MKNAKTELKNSIESFISRLDCAEERINDLKARTLFAPVRGAKRKKKKNEKNEEGLWDSWDTITVNYTYIIRISGEKETENIFKAK